MEPGASRAGPRVRAVACPTCGAPPGEPCRDGPGTVALGHHHPERHRVIILGRRDDPPPERAPEPERP